VSRREPRTLVELAVSNVGLFAAPQALAHLACWCIARHKIGPEMSAEDYGEWWGISRPSAFRHQAMIRRAFPGVDPERVYQVWCMEYRRRMVDRDSAAAARMAGELVGLELRRL
jgi:hypothetical protein